MFILLIQDNEAANEDWHSLKHSVGWGVSFWEASPRKSAAGHRVSRVPVKHGEMSAVQVAFGNVDHYGLSLNKCETNTWALE